MTPYPKFKKALRIISAALTIATLLCFCVGCTVSKVGDYTVNTETVMKINGYKVTFDEYRCFYLKAKSELEQGDGTIWYDEDAPFDQLNEIVLGTLKRKYATMKLIDKYDIELTSADKEDINNTVSYYMEEHGGETGYRQWLASEGLTGRLFREQYALVYFYDEYLREILYTGIDDMIKVDDKTVTDDIRENFYRYTWIFIPFDENDNYLDNAKKIEEAHKALESGKDFYETADKYSEWMGNEKIGIYAAKGEKIPLLEETALKLENGEYSRVLAMEEGHAILMRLPLDDDYINSNFDDFVYQSATRRYNILLDELAEEAEVEFTKYYETLTMEIIISSKDYYTDN